MAGEMPPAPALWLQPGLWVRTRPPPPEKPGKKPEPSLGPLSTLSKSSDCNDCAVAGSLSLPSDKRVPGIHTKLEQVYLFGFSRFGALSLEVGNRRV